MEFSTPCGSRWPLGVLHSAPSLLAVLCLALLPLAAPSPALALSEIKREELPAPPTQSDENNPENAVPLPNPIEPPSATPESEDPDTVIPGETTPPDAVTPPAEDANAPLPEIIYDLNRLPPEVKRMRDLLVEASKSGDIEKLRPLVGLGDEATQLSLGGMDGDPIAFLKGLSGDPDGQEILAIMEEVLSAGYVHLDAGTPEELYVWPYFFAMPLNKLDARQHVELFKIVTAGDYEDMKTFGSYIFYRLGITPEGRWAFFVAGE